MLNDKSSETDLNPVKQSQAKKLARIRRYLSIIDIVLSLGIAAVLVFTGLSGAFIRMINLPVIAAAVVYIAILMAGYHLLFSPLNYYSDFVLGHRYRLSTESFRSWITDEFKSFGLGLVLGAAIIALLYRYITLLPSFWWLAAWATMILISIVISNIAPIILIPIFYKMRPLDNLSLKDRLEQLLIKTGTRVQGIYLIEFSQKGTIANAALMGMGNTRRIVLSDTLLQQYTPEEIEVITAHEIGHYKHKDILRLLGTQSVSLLLVFFVSFLIFRSSVTELGFKGMSDVAALPWLAIIFGTIGFLIMPLSNAFGRYIEKQADGYSLKLTDNPGSFISAMTKLTDQNLAEAESARWIEVLLHDHPSFKQRVRHAKEYENSRIKSC